MQNVCHIIETCSPVCVPRAADPARGMLQRLGAGPVLLTSH